MQLHGKHVRALHWGQLRRCGVWVLMQKQKWLCLGGHPAWSTPRLHRLIERTTCTSDTAQAAGSGVGSGPKKIAAVWTSALQRSL